MVRRTTYIVRRVVYCALGYSLTYNDLSAATHTISPLSPVKINPLQNFYSKKYFTSRLETSVRIPKVIWRKGIGRFKTLPYSPVLYQK